MTSTCKSLPVINIIIREKKAASKRKRIFAERTSSPAMNSFHYMRFRLSCRFYWRQFLAKTWWPWRSLWSGRSRPFSISFAQQLPRQRKRRKLSLFAKKKTPTKTRRWSWFNQNRIMEEKNVLLCGVTQWNWILALGKKRGEAAGGRMCSEMNRYYIFESSPLKHFSRFDAERCAMVLWGPREQLN